jgi:hypothetical protein
MTPPSAMLLPLYWMLIDSGGTEEGTVRKKEEQSVVFDMSPLSIIAPKINNK